MQLFAETALLLLLLSRWSHGRSLSSHPQFAGPMFVRTMIVGASNPEALEGTATKLLDAGGAKKMRVEMRGETKAFLEFLRETAYDRRHRPAPDGKESPTEIVVSVLVGSVRSVSESSMDYSVELYFRERWLDPRLRFGDSTKSEFENRTHLNLHESYVGHLWLPDTFVPNGIASVNAIGNSITHRALLRLSPDGAVLYSRRISLTAECPMDLALYPFDRQICKLELESYGHPMTQITYKWDPSSEHPVHWNPDKVKLPGFDLETVVVNKTIGLYSTGNYSRLVACFFLSRNAGFCILQLVFPATVVVVAAWVSLWLENEATFQDMISVILTMTFLIYSYNASMPRVAYLKAMDVYLCACFCFVFFSLIKLAIIKCVRQKLRMRPDEPVLFKRSPMLSTMVQRACQAVGATNQLHHQLHWFNHHDHQHDNDKDNGVGCPQQTTVDMQQQHECFDVLDIEDSLNKTRLRSFHLCTQAAFPLALLTCFAVYLLAQPSIYNPPPHVCLP